MKRLNHATGKYVMGSHRRIHTASGERKPHRPSRSHSPYSLASPIQTVDRAAVSASQSRGPRLARYANGASQRSRRQTNASRRPAIYEKQNSERETLDPRRWAGTER